MGTQPNPTLPRNTVVPGYWYGSSPYGQRVARGTHHPTPDDAKIRFDTKGLRPNIRRATFKDIQAALRLNIPVYNDHIVRAYLNALTVLGHGRRQAADKLPVPGYWWVRDKDGVSVTKPASPPRTALTYRPAFVLDHQHHQCADDELMSDIQQVLLTFDKEGL